jgi:hypothetical protein
MARSERFELPTLRYHGRSELVKKYSKLNKFGFR